MLNCSKKERGRAASVVCSIYKGFQAADQADTELGRRLGRHRVRQQTTLRKSA